MNLDVMQQVMSACNNHFVRHYMQGEFSIENGVLAGVDAKGCALVYITGSAQHEGLHRVEPEADGVTLVGDAAPDENFDGVVYLLAVPAAFVRLCDDIADWQQKNPVGGLQSESFGAYSYSRATGAHGSLTWQEQHANALAPYRRMFDDLTEVNAC